MARWPQYNCACEFAKAVGGDTNPCNFQRVGLADNVLLRGRFINRHTPTGVEAILGGSRGGMGIPPEAAECCFTYFEQPQ